MRSDANAASMSAAAAAAAVKQEPASAPEDSKEAAQGELGSPRAAGQAGR